MAQSPGSGADIAKIDGFEAPYLIDKLLKERVAATVAEGLALFCEMKRYLYLSHRDRSASWGMYSARVDEVWHQFVLFTRQYMAFCQDHFGEFLHHQPSNAPDAQAQADAAGSTFEGFATRYEAVFGHALPAIWYDDRAVTPSHRVINDNAGAWCVTVEGEMACLAAPDGSLEIMVETLAHEALAFIAQTDAFHIRELPGSLTDDEKMGLIAALVGQRHLRLAP